MTIDAAVWVVLDNIKYNWPYRTNLDKDTAELAYLRAMRDGYVREGKLTSNGEVALITHQIEEERRCSCL